MDFCDVNKFASFTGEHGIKSFSAKHIKSLWQTGLLKADFVLTQDELQIEGLSLLGCDQRGKFWYSDDRTSKFSNGLSDLLKELDELPHDVNPYFHPFRYAVFMYLSGVLRPKISPIQEILYSAGSIQMLERWQRWFSEYTSSQEFLDNIKYHEEVVKLCVATEPCTYQLLFSTVRRSVLVSEETQQAQINDYCERLTNHYKQLSLEPVVEASKKLCIAAEILDPNKAVHGILRLTRGEKRIRQIKGKLGGAILLLTMAEMLRRFSEQTFNVKLPEEDELGFGYYPEGVKENIYDANRLYDGNRRSANLFLREWGLDYGVRLRWYVEGDTELGALEWMFSNNHSIELINLRGQVAERGGKGLTFRENLLNDLRAQIFSLVTIDSDVSDNVRVVRKAAENDEICGGFFVSDPNFEEMNFALHELREIIGEIAIENGATVEQKAVFENATNQVKSFSDLLNSARRALPILNQEGKGRKWGARLMRYAWSNRSIPTTSANETKTRPIVEAVLAGLRARSASYLHTRRDYKVDPITGKLVQRNN